MWLHIHLPTSNVNSLFATHRMSLRWMSVRTHPRWVCVSVRADTLAWRVLVLCGHYVQMRVRAGEARTRIGVVVTRGWMVVAARGCMVVVVRGWLVVAAR